MLEISYTQLKNLNLPISYIVSDTITNLYCVLDKNVFAAYIHTPEDIEDFQTNYTTATQIYSLDELSFNYGLYKKEDPTFCLYVENLPLNGSLISIFNSSQKSIQIKKIYCINTAIAYISGSTIPFQLKRIGGHSGGTDLVSSVECYDNRDTLDNLISIKNGATLTGLSSKIIKKIMFTTNNLTTSSLDTANISSQQNIFQTFFPMYDAFGEKPIILRENEGLTLMTATFVSGQFDVEMLFTTV